MHALEVYQSLDNVLLDVVCPRLVN